ncbi:alkaline phosphatase family protein [Nocardioides sp. DS6]|uniref:Alkaline phosphatase family protein n=1 Tax=Nocardioides eburneus TaxID=3231482 RepID=A0ABV3T1V1_9ACTN
MRKPTVRLSRTWKGAGLALAGAGLLGGSLTYFTSQGASAADKVQTATPIKHVVVLFSENISFDHYFGTYPYATNKDANPAAPTFTAAPGTPVPNNYKADPTLISANPNSTKPFRLGYDDAWTCSQNHAYTPEQKAEDGGKMDLFPENTNGGCTAGTGPAGAAINMGYYDGNTVTGFWNYAQNYAMSDNSWDTTFGPSTVGAMNVIAGQTYGGIAYDATSDDTNPTPAANKTASGFSAVDPDTGLGTVIGDPDPVYDDCSDNNHASSSNLVGMQGKNIGDLLNEKHLTWGWFQGGFTPTTAYDPENGAAYAKCQSTDVNLHGSTVTDYSPHHNPFAYYKSTSNPHHYPGTEGVTLGADDPTDDATHTGANHEYDLSVFEQAVADDQLPAVSYVKADAYQDGHPSNSDPIDEQHFLVREINAIEQSPEWKSTAIVISYDDSDGWYDHQAPTILNPSSTSDDAAICTAAAQTADPIAGEEDRCGPSQRLPMVVISPYAKKNYIDHNISNQASIVKFIEDNWGLGTIKDDFGDGPVEDSFDATAGSIEPMFDFQHPSGNTVVLNDDGTVKSTSTVKVPPAGGYSSRLSVTVPPHAYGRPGKATVRVSTDGDPDGGTVTATIDHKPDGAPAVVDGKAVVTLPARLAVGRHTLQLTYSGSADAKGATASRSFTVTKAVTRTAVKAGRVARGTVPVAVTVTATGVTPTGKVTVKVNGRTAGAAVLRSGHATLVVGVRGGSNRIVATYPGGANVAGSTSAAAVVRGRVPATHAKHRRHR